MTDEAKEFDADDNHVAFGMIPKAVMLDKRLTNNDRATYATLATFRNRKTGEAWPKQKTLAEALGSERTVRRSVKHLQQLGLLTMRRQKTGGRWGRTTYKLLGWELPEPTIQRPVQASGLFDDQRPERVPDQRPGVAALTSTNQTSTHQELAPAGAGAPSTNGMGVRKNGITRQDVAEAAQIATRLVGWFERQYHRPHWAVTERDKMALAQVVAKIRLLLVKHPELGTNSPTEVIVKAVDAAISDKHNVFPLNRGEDLTLRVLTQHWHRLFDNVMKAAQDAGQLPPPHDVDLHQEQM